MLLGLPLGSFQFADLLKVAPAMRYAAAHLSLHERGKLVQLLGLLGYAAIPGAPPTDEADGVFLLRGEHVLASPAGWVAEYLDLDDEAKTWRRLGTYPTRDAATRALVLSRDGECDPGEGWASYEPNTYGGT